jgi:hypothetical protein
MQSGQSTPFQIIKIYKAPQKGKGQKLLKEGFQPADFPYNPPYFDGMCYFVRPNDRSMIEALLSAHCAPYRWHSLLRSPDRAKLMLVDGKPFPPFEPSVSSQFQSHYL